MMNQECKNTLRVAAVVFLLYLCLFLVYQPRVVRYSEDVTIRYTRMGEIHVNHPPGYRITIWYQDIERGINVRLLVLPW